LNIANTKNMNQSGVKSDVFNEVFYSASFGF